MNKNIHSTANIHSSAIIGDNTLIGPYSIIGKNVTIGNNCIIDSHVNFHQDVLVGDGCKFYSSASIGTDPQDLKYVGEKSKLIIGNGTIIREFCTLNRGTKETGKTIIGDNCLLMAYVHVAHDCIVGNKVILANGVQLGGHVIIEDDVTIGGMTPIHQFCQLGEHSFVAGGYRVVQDVPPYILAQGEPLQYYGINSVGLKRKGFNGDTRRLIKKVYSFIYKSNMNLTQAMDKINKDLEISKEVKSILSFIKKSNRGLI